MLTVCVVFVHVNNNPAADECKLVSVYTFTYLLHIDQRNTHRSNSQNTTRGCCGRYLEREFGSRRPPRSSSSSSSSSSQLGISHLCLFFLVCLDCIAYIFFAPAGLPRQSAPIFWGAYCCRFDRVADTISSSGRTHVRAPPKTIRNKADKSVSSFLHHVIGDRFPARSFRAHRRRRPVPGARALPADQLDDRRRWFGGRGGRRLHGASHSPGAAIG